jgi:hypothetical protein
MTAVPLDNGPLCIRRITVGMLSFMLISATELAMAKKPELGLLISKWLL